MSKLPQSYDHFVAEPGMMKKEKKTSASFTQAARHGGRGRGQGQGQDQLEGRETLFFNDGRTRIDIILAYQDVAHADDRAGRGGEEASEEEVLRVEEDRRKRGLFETNLGKQGLLLELEPPEVGELARGSTTTDSAVCTRKSDPFGLAYLIKCPSKKKTEILCILCHKLPATLSRTQKPKTQIMSVFFFSGTSCT